MRILYVLIFIQIIGSLFPIASIAGFQKTYTDTVRSGSTHYGIASFYSDKFIGKKTANGDIFSQDKMTAANNFLPLGTRIRVINLRNNRQVIVKVNDRLHHRNKRLVDLSKAAARKLGFIQSGVTRVKIQILDITSVSE